VRDKRQIKTSSNPTLLTLLSMGATVVLANGQYMHGDKESRQIEFGHLDDQDVPIPAGRSPLGHDGLKSMLNDPNFNRG
jgi:hypothetical protein